MKAPAWAGVGLLMLAIGGIGFFGAINPIVFAVLVAVVCISGAACLAYRFPDRALGVCFFVVLLAATKFRRRDASASLEGALDSQIFLELALYGVLALLLVVVALSAQFRPSVLTRMEALLAAYVVWAFCSILWSAAPALTLVRSTQLLILFALGALSIRLLGPARTLLSSSQAVLVYVIGCAGLASVFPWASGVNVNYQGVARFSWFSVHPITAATLLGIAATLVTSRILSPEKTSDSARTRLLSWGCIALLLLFLLLTKSRGPLLAFVGAATAMCVLRYVRLWAGAALLSVLLISMVALATTGWTAEELLQSGARQQSAAAQAVFRGQSADQLLSFTGRVDLWKELTPVFLEQPFVGHGYQAARAAILKLRPWAGHAHNAFIQSLLDLGIIGTLAIFLPLAVSVVLGAISSRFRLAAAGSRIYGATFGVGVFLLLNSLTSESFAGAPGYEILLLFTSLQIRDRAFEYQSELRLPYYSSSEFAAKYDGLRPVGHHWHSRMDRVSKY